MSVSPEIEVRDNQTWITREKFLETSVMELTAERDFLREILRAVLSGKASNDTTNPGSEA